MVTMTTGTADLMKVARYIRTTKPTTGFLVKMRNLIEFGHILTDGQIAASVNIIEERLDDEYRAHVRALLAPPAPDKVAVAAPIATPTTLAYGVYTIEFDGGASWVTLRVLKSHNPTYPQPKLDLLTGPDNEVSFTSLGRIVDGKLRTFYDGRQILEARPEVRRAIEVLFSSDVAELATAGQAYSRHSEVYEGEGAARVLVSVRCYRCGRTLSVPSSIKQGMGDDCLAQSFAF